jgi:Tol biopolymer transport system component
MTTTAIPSPTEAAASRLHWTRRRLALAVIVPTLAAAAAATSLELAGSAGPSSTPVATAAAAPEWTPFGLPWLEAVDVRDLKRQLLQAGYQVKVDDTLDPVTESALADYLQPGSASSLGPVGQALAGTVLLGRQNPVAWNRRFGLDRPTKFVERPLTGRGGQLDANGNLRTPLAVLPSGRQAAAAAPRNGKIAFVDRTETLDVVNPNGAGRRRLVHCPVAITICEITGYAWAPNGKRLAFLRGHAGSADTVSDLSLYVINADGTGMRRLVHCGRCGGSRVAWSPDGSGIVFATADGLRLIGVSSGTQLRLTDSADADPAWSPSGSTIAFARGGSIYTIKPDATGLTELASLPGWVDHPAWAPDGTRIVFDELSAGSDGIYVVNVDGSQLTLLRAGSEASGPGTPSWSPNGHQILFFNTPRLLTGFTAEVWVMKPDGSDARRLYHSRCCVGVWNPPIWSPDGKSIAFSADSAGGIFLIRTNGRHRRRLSRRASEIAWQSIPRSR